MTGYNTYTGDTVIDGGVLGLSGKLDNSNVTINTSGTLLAKNNEKPVEIGQSVTNNGSLDVYGKGLSIGGNYTADKDARTVIDIHTALLEIKGTADMQNSRILADVEKINDVPTQSESLRTILKAGNLVNYNNFYTVSDHIAPYILVSKIEKQGNEIQATYKRNQTANVLRSVGTVSRSAENTSANLDKVLDEVAKNPTSSIKADSVSIINAKPMSVASTVESLSAEIYASSQNMIVNENRLFSQNIAERAFHSLQDEKSDVYAVTNRQSYQISQNGYANAEIEGNQSYVGADKQTDRLLFGISAYHSRQKADFERTAGSAKLHQQGGAIYAGYQLDNNYLLAQLGMANAKNKIKRSILMPNETRRVETEVKSKLYHFYTELGHRIKFEQGEISPFIGYQFDSVYQKAFDEGKNFGIQANRTQYNLNSYLLGLRATMKWGDLSLNTTLSHRMTQKAENAFGFNARYIGAESEIELQGISPAKYVTMAKLGLNYQISEALHLFGEYAIARQKGGEKWQNVSVGMKYQF
ncbi:autotransporter domain-containing protein [Glaesserella parasuis]|nr:autotransporter domain-containing protein [Glaesserella parasuis]